LPDRLVLDFADHVVLEVRQADGGIVFDRSLPPDVESHLVLDHILPLWLARQGLLVLHGGMVAKDSGAVVLTGHSGVGKSTMTAFLGGQGWRPAGDDAVMVTSGPPPIVQATYPTMRLTPNAVTELLDMPGHIGTYVAGKRRVPLSADAAHLGPAPLAVVVRLRPVDAGSPAVFDRVRGAAALDLLLTNTFHADLGRGQGLANVITRLAELAESVIVGELSVPRGKDGLAAAATALAGVRRS
jgi:hypothetical protein